MSLQYLKAQLASKQPRIKLRYDYYEMKDKHLPRNLFVPQEMAYKFSQQMGWCTKAVDSLADRLQFRGFRNDNYNLNSIYALNNADILYSSAILSALISSCSFIYISADIEGDPKFQVIDGYNATGIIDDTTGMLKEGYAILDRDEFGYPILEAYFESGKTTFFRKLFDDLNKEYIELDPEEVYNTAPYPLLVPIINRPDAIRPFGHSRISRSCMSYQDNAKDTLVNMAICSEVYSFPQKYLITDNNTEMLNANKASMSKFLQITMGEDGKEPKVGQFSQAAMTPYLEEIKTQASLFAGETGLTIDDLGFTTSNPSSAEAIRASHENLRLEATKAQKHFGIGFLNAGYLGACIRDKFPYKRSELYNTIPLWEQVFTPDYNAMGAIGDAVVKINQAIPDFITSENMRDLTGIDPVSQSGGTF